MCIAAVYAHFSKDLAHGKKTSKLLLQRGSDALAQAYRLHATPQVMLDVTGLGPRAAISLLKERLPQVTSSRELWLWNAKISAILGSCPKTRSSFQSGM